MAQQITLDDGTLQGISTQLKTWAQHASSVERGQWPAELGFVYAGTTDQPSTSDLPPGSLSVNAGGKNFAVGASIKQHVAKAGTAMGQRLHTMAAASGDYHQQLDAFRTDNNHIEDLNSYTAAQLDRYFDEDPLTANTGGNNPDTGRND